SPDGRRLATVDSGSGQRALPGELKVWNLPGLPDARPAASFRWEVGGFSVSLAFSPDGQMVTGSLGASAGFCDLSSGRVFGWFRTSRHMPHWGGASSPDGRLVAL